MPSSPGYKRNYAHEYQTAMARGEREPHAERLRARRAAVKMGMVKPHDNKDLDHKHALSMGGSNKPSNWRVRSEHANRSFPRRPDGSMIRNVPKGKK